MAVIKPTASMINGTNDFLVVSWLDVTTADTCEAYELPTFADKTVHVTGTPGVGGTVILEGSNLLVSYDPLHDPQGNNLTFTASGIEMLTENPKSIRPRVTAGDGTTSLTISIACRGAR